MEPSTNTIYGLLAELDSGDLARISNAVSELRRKVSPRYVLWLAITTPDDKLAVRLLEAIMPIWSDQDPRFLSMFASRVRTLNRLPRPSEIRWLINELASDDLECRAQAAREFLEAFDKSMIEDYCVYSRNPELADLIHGVWFVLTSSDGSTGYVPQIIVAAAIPDGLYQPTPN